MQPKVLLVDDREDNLLSIESILAPDGYQVVKANSGRQALRILLNEYDFALILMDVKMPNLNGFETATLIYERQKLKHIPIIFVTAHNEGEEEIYKGYKSGAVDYIYKPINPDLLRAKVSVFIDIYRKNRILIAQEQKLIAINGSLELEINERRASEEQVKNLNRKLLENIDRLEAANRDLDRFAFMASHDLQEPLRKIRVFGDRLGTQYQHVLDNEGKRDIQRIQKSAERMQSLISDIMTFSKLSFDKTSLVKSDLKILMDEVLNDLEEEIQRANAKIIFDKKLPELLVNPSLMKSLFQNLISNAIKYAKKDTASVVKISYENGTTSDIRLGSNNEQTKYCRITIEDNGIGFDQKHAQEIFGMFKRLHHNSEYEGTGIGLALCKKIIELHNGYIAALSKLNEGSTFIISLPAQN